jgi:hypothetical protein
MPDIHGTAKVLDVNHDNGKVLLELPSGPVWAMQAYLRDDGLIYPVPNAGDEIFYTYFTCAPEYACYHMPEWLYIKAIKVIEN